MAVSGGAQNLLNQDGSITLCEFLAPLDFIEQLPTRDQILHNIEPVLILKIFEDSDDVGVVELLQNFNFIVKLSCLLQI